LRTTNVESDFAETRLGTFLFFKSEIASEFDEKKQAQDFGTFLHCKQ
jgi:hypothetical protein